LAQEPTTMSKRNSRLFRGKGSDEDARPIWPHGKPLPRFRSDAEEIRFWHSYQFEDPPASAMEEIEYVPQATRQPRQHVYRVRFDDLEMATLQALAKRRGVHASVVLRELLREAAKKAS
jgi:hypothetical protein